MDWLASLTRIKSYCFSMDWLASLTRIKSYCFSMDWLAGSTGKYKILLK